MRIIFAKFKELDVCLCKSFNDTYLRILLSRNLCRTSQRNLLQRVDDKHVTKCTIATDCYQRVASSVFWTQEMRRGKLVFGYRWMPWPLELLTSKAFSFYRHSLEYRLQSIQELRKYHTMMTTSPWTIDNKLGEKRFYLFVVFTTI